MKTQYKKYPRTPHFSWSEGMTNDDKMLKSLDNFIGKRVICSVKFDGENCLDGSTVLETSLGTKTIKEIVDNKLIGLLVKSYNMVSDSIEMQEIYNVSSHDNDSQWYEIELEDGTILVVTENHYIWLDNLNCYRRVKDILNTDQVKKSL